MKRGAEAPPAPRRVLIVKPSALGDVITALPVLRGLRRSFPEAEVTWLVNTAYAPLLAEDPDLHATIAFDRRGLGRWWRSPTAARELASLKRRLREGRFDWAIDLQGLFRSGWLARKSGAPVRAGFSDARELAPHFYTHRIRATAEHTVDRNIELARALGVDARGQDLRLHVPAGGRQTAAERLSALALAEGQYAVLAPAARWRTKMYPVRRWRQLVGELIKRMPVLLLGARGEEAICEAVAAGLGPGVHNLCGQTGLPETTALAAGAAAVVCNDSGIMNIASAVGRPPVVVIGPTRSGHTGPYTGTAVVAEVACQGCRKKRCRHVTCMESIEPSRILSAVEGCLDAGSDSCR